MSPQVQSMKKRLQEGSSSRADMKAHDEVTSPPHPPAPYESHLVCEFFRQIGQLEVAQIYEAGLKTKAQELLETVVSEPEVALRKTAIKDLKALLNAQKTPLVSQLATLVGNAQNPLDHLVGDVLGQTVPGRYFIIEFKRYAPGFVDEVSLALGKPDRVALIENLLANRDCRDLSRHGHLGAYWDGGKIVFGKYFELARQTAKKSVPLPDFYEAMQESTFAWDSKGLRDYIECMTYHGVDLATDGGQVVFGYFDQAGRFVAMTGTSKIFAMIQRAFKRADAMGAQREIAQQPIQQSNHRPPGSRL